MNNCYNADYITSYKEIKFKFMHNQLSLKMTEAHATLYQYQLVHGSLSGKLQHYRISSSNIILLICTKDIKFIVPTSLMSEAI